jgi:hypothetical protein
MAFRAALQLCRNPPPRPEQMLPLRQSQHLRHIWFPDSCIRTSPPRADLGLKSLPGGVEAVSGGTFLAQLGCSSFRLARRVQRKEQLIVGDVPKSLVLRLVRAPPPTQDISIHF